MKKSTQLSDKWLKASVMGCLWASSEIVLGSFLHNLRIPFSGNILTAIGIIIVLAVGQKWRERGLFWRAGLICALLKSLSPSAVILGPMVSIFAEGLLLELACLLIGRNIAGCLIAGALAMSWNLFYFIINNIVVYGPDMIKLYMGFIKFIEKQLGVHHTSYWQPVLVVLCFYVLFGLISAALGIYIGRKKENTTFTEFETDAGKSNAGKKFRQTNGNEIKPSIIFLILNVVLIVGALIVFNLDNLLIESAVVIIVVAFWAIYYKNSLRFMLRPGFWIWFMLITIGSSLLISSFKTDLMSGLWTGIEMNLRAVLVMTGFAVVGRELRNPVISEWFAGSRFRQLPLACEVAFESLPLFLQSMPGAKTMITKPVAVFASFIHRMDFWLEQMQTSQNKQARVIIISGGKNEGKTSCLKKIVEELKGRKVKLQGFIALAVFDEKERIGYDLQNIATGETFELARTTGDASMVNTIKYFFRDEALHDGIKILQDAALADTDFIVIDEIGFLELQGDGWADVFTQLLKNPKLKLICAVRREYIEELKNKWNIDQPLILDIADTSPENMVEKMLAKF